MKIETLKITLWVAIISALFFVILIFFNVPPVNIKTVFEIFKLNYFVICGFIFFVSLAILSYFYYLAFTPIEKSIKAKANQLIKTLNQKIQKQDNKEKKLAENLENLYSKNMYELKKEFEEKENIYSQKIIKINKIEEDLKTRIKEFEEEKTEIKAKLTEIQNVNARLIKKNNKLKIQDKPL